MRALSAPMEMELLDAPQQLIVLLGVLITLAAHLLDLLDHNSSLLGSCRTTGILM